MDAANETWADVEKLVYHTIHRFIRTHGGEFADCLGVAHTTYMKAYDNFDGRASFSAWIATKIWYGLLDDLRRRTRTASREVMDDTDLTTYAAPEGQGVFDLEAFLSELSEDGALITKLILDLPPEIQREADLFGGSHESTRAAVRYHLRSIGWAKKRVSESFEEISFVLWGWGE
jgi:DNA-directed RNA polymerase specialized sigma24 family protein